MSKYHDEHNKKQKDGETTMAETKERHTSKLNVTEALKKFNKCSDESKYV